MNWRKWLFRLVVLPVARAPSSVRYVLSDGIAFVLRRVVKYRRAVIDGNIAIAFPERSLEERIAIRDGFYQHFTDVALEQTWLFAASTEEVLKHCRIATPGLLEGYAEQGRPVFLCAGHFANFEMAATAVAMQVPQRVAGIYAPLANPYFDERVRDTRGKFGLQLWPRAQTRERFEEWDAQGGSYLILFATDQSPHGGAKKTWIEFFGRPTAHARGIENYARRYDAAVVYGRVERVRRGYYQFSFDIVTEHPREEAPGAIIQRQARMLETSIRSDPSSWLWSHRRWKLSPERDTTPDDEFVGVERPAGV